VDFVKSDGLKLGIIIQFPLIHPKRISVGVNVTDNKAERYIKYVNK
jgi:hypothetical protein